MFVWIWSRCRRRSWNILILVTIFRPNLTVKCHCDPVVAAGLLDAEDVCILTRNVAIKDPELVFPVQGRRKYENHWTTSTLQAGGGVALFVPTPGRCPPWSRPAPTPLCPRRRRNPTGCKKCHGQTGSRLHRSVWGRRCGGATWTPRWWCWETPGRGESPAAATRRATVVPAAPSQPAGHHCRASTAARWARSRNPSCKNKPGVGVDTWVRSRPLGEDSAH